MGSKKTNIKFYDEDYLAGILKMERRAFHRKIKPIIMKDFQMEIKKLKCDNPDIGLDSNHILHLGNPSHTIIVSTGISIFDYLELK